jgi:hypothetical protein
MSSGSHSGVVVKADTPAALARPAPTATSISTGRTLASASPTVVAQQPSSGVTTGQRSVVDSRAGAAGLHPHDGKTTGAGHSAAETPGNLDNGTMVERSRHYPSQNANYARIFAAYRKDRDVKPDP